MTHVSLLIPFLGVTYYSISSGTKYDSTIVQSSNCVTRKVIFSKYKEKPTLFEVIGYIIIIIIRRFIR